LAYSDNWLILTIAYHAFIKIDPTECPVCDKQVLSRLGSNRLNAIYTTTLLRHCYDTSSALKGLLHLLGLGPGPGSGLDLGSYRVTIFFFTIGVQSASEEVPEGRNFRGRGGQRVCECNMILHHYGFIITTLQH